MIKIAGRGSANPTKNRLYYCPFQALRDYIQTRPSARNLSKQFFIYADGSAVTPDRLRRILKFMLNKLNIDDRLYNLHSLRIGQCSDLYAHGVSVETIKKIGRWKSNAIFTYLRS